MMMSVIVPVYGCSSSLEELYIRLKTTLETISVNFELILVNDDCPRNSWEVIKKLAAQDKRVIGINLSRNFGQIRAITAGLDHASGDLVVVMDCDLQDQPEEIISLYNKLQEGYDVVFARRHERQDHFMTRLVSNVFYRIYSWFIGAHFDQTLCNFSISKKMVIDGYVRMREQNRSWVMFIQWLGFKQTSLNVKHAKRKEGKSSYTLAKRLRLASHVITSQSNKPLLIFLGFGFITAFCSFAYAFSILLRYFFFGISMVGWASVIVSIFFFGGLILVNLGIVGLYIGYLFNEIKSRPLYLIREIINKEEYSIPD